MGKGSDDVCSFPSSEVAAELPVEFEGAPAARSPNDDLTLPAGRTPEIDWRVAVHEASHCVAARYFDLPLGGATVKPRGGCQGLVWGPKYEDRAAFDESSSVVEKPVEVCEIARTLTLQPGESHDVMAPFYVVAKAHIIELLAGNEGERVLCPGDEPLPASRDHRQAREFASVICQAEAVEAFIAYGKVEAAAIIRNGSHITLALAEALVERRTLDAAEIDAVIADAVSREAIRVEQERRIAWKDIAARAANFPQDH